MILLLLLTAPYFIVMAWIYIGFSKLTEVTGNSISEMLKPATLFTIIVPFRNESNNLPSLLKSIIGLDYPGNLFEVIFVDDYSSDDSIDVIKKIIDAYNEKAISKITYRIIQNDKAKNSPKKAAISKAIQTVNTEWIFTTDADCILPSTLLKAYDTYIQKNNVSFIAGPVLFTCDKRFAHRYQFLDTLSLQITTMGSFGNNNPLMCNGANMTYKKEAFENVNGYDGNEHVASGDDVFLLQKIKSKYPNQATYLKSKDAIVRTLPQPNWHTLIQQRTRWAKKTSQQNNYRATIIGLSVLLMNSIVLLTPLILLYFSSISQGLIYIVIGKFFMDLLLLQSVATFFEKRISLLSFVFTFISYPVILIRVLGSIFNKDYSWKGRTFKS